MAFLETLSLAASGMDAHGSRMRLVSENIANADTPGYRRKITTFETVMGDGGVALGDVSLDRSALAEIYDPSHPMADRNGTVAMSNVDLITEIADARQAQRGYEANMSIFDQARRMYSDALDLLKR